MEANCPQKPTGARKNLFKYLEKKNLWHEGSKAQREHDMSSARDNQHSTRAGLQESTEDVSIGWRNDFQRPLLT